MDVMYSSIIHVQIEDMLLENGIVLFLKDVSRLA